MVLFFKLNDLLLLLSSLGYITEEEKLYIVPKRHTVGSHIYNMRNKLKRCFYSVSSASNVQTLCLADDIGI